MSAVGANDPSTCRNVATAGRVPPYTRPGESKVRRLALDAVGEALAVRLALDIGDRTTAARHARAAADLTAHVAALIVPTP